MTEPRVGRARRIVCVMSCALVMVSGSVRSAEAEDPISGTGPGLPEEPIPLAELPERPRPLIELGEQYLAPSSIAAGWTLPTGAVWQPSFLAWGIARSAIQAETGKGLDRLQWANRLELFGQLALTPTERFVVSLEPFQGGSEYTGYRFGVGGAEGEFVNGFDVTPDTLFFEGDFGELFPILDRRVVWPLDLGFMVGRVPVVFQDGFLIDDRMTAFGLVQNSILARGTSNLRISLITAWDGVHRGDNSPGGDSWLTGLFAEFDRAATTWAVDAVFVEGDEEANGVFGGLSGIRRVAGRWNLSSRLLGSHRIGNRVGDEVENGLLGVVGVSFAPRRTHDVAYLNAVVSLGHYTPAARAADRGGPLGRLGILFEAPGLGSIGSALASDADRVFAAALGIQLFFDHGRTQVVLEVAGRGRFESSRDRATGAGVRVERALGRRVVLRFDGYGGIRRGEGGFVGGRSEIVLKF